MTKSHRMKLTATVFDAKKPRKIVLQGQQARTLKSLVERKTDGVTALEISSWALRLSAYVHILRHDYGLAIETQWEKHPGGQHARYVLHTPVEIEAME